MNSQIDLARYEALLAGMTAVLWALIIVLLHFIKPQLRPAIHMVSEYARKPKGWIMQIAFFSMGVSCFSLTLAGWSYLPHLGLILLAIIGVGFTAAGAFVTDPSFATEENTTLSGRLHNTFAFIVIPLFPVMATLVSIGMAGNSLWISIHSLLPILAGLTWLGSIGFLWAVVGSASETEREATHIPIGYYQRFMIFSFSLWLIIASLAMAMS